MERSIEFAPDDVSAEAAAWREHNHDQNTKLLFAAKCFRVARKGQRGPSWVRAIYRGYYGVSAEKSLTPPVRLPMVAKITQMDNDIIGLLHRQWVREQVKG